MSDDRPTWHPTEIVDGREPMASYLRFMADTIESRSRVASHWPTIYRDLAEGIEACIPVAEVLAAIDEVAEDYYGAAVMMSERLGIGIGEGADRLGDL